MGNPLKWAKKNNGMNYFTLWHSATFRYNAPTAKLTKEERLRNSIKAIAIIRARKRKVTLPTVKGFTDE